MNQFKMLFIQTSTLTPSTQQKLVEHGMFCMQNNQLPTKTLVESKVTQKHYIFGLAMTSKPMGVEFWLGICVVT
jgi:hypothetical protein